MKKLYFLITLFCLSANAQPIDFPDPNLKAALLLQPDFGIWSLDANDDGEISIVEAQNWDWPLNISNSNISDLTGLEHFMMLGNLNASNNLLSSVDLSPFTILENIDLHNNQLTSFVFNASQSALFGYLNIDLTGNPLDTVIIISNPSSNFNFNALRLSALPANFSITGYLNSLQLIDIVDTSIYMPPYEISELVIQNAYNLEFVSVRTGHANSLLVYNAPLLSHICIDGDLPYINELGFWVDQTPIDPNNNNPTDIVFTNNCNVASYGNFNEVNGITRFDGDANGCGPEDIAMPIKYQITGLQNIIVSSGSEGNYRMLLTAGDYTITPIPENDYFAFTPANGTFTFPIDGNEFTQDFCMIPNGVHADLEVAIVPHLAARPGFDATYKLIYKNKGNVELNGSVSFTYVNNVEFVSAVPNVSSQAVQVLNWDYTDLQPFEQREIVVVMNVNSPTETPAVNGGDVLVYSATGSTSVTDEMPADNNALLNQTVVNSFDPNDKTCLEGNTIEPSMVGKYVHYQIRFENEGTANAENIVVKDIIDTDKFDISSLVPMDGSHDFVTRITGNKVEFIFENIQLPFDEANNDGYVMFKIKTKSTLVVGDSFSNSASIYFDYNHPIVTDPAVTTIQLLEVKDFEFWDEFVVYPNPAHDVLNIQSKGNAKINSIDIYNTLGQLVLAVTNAENVSNIDVSDLASGSYFLKVVSDKGSSNARFVKK